MQYKQIFKNKNYIHFRLIQRRRTLCFISNNNIYLKVVLTQQQNYILEFGKNEIPKIIDHKLQSCIKMTNLGGNVRHK